MSSNKLPRKNRASFRLWFRNGKARFLQASLKEKVIGLTGFAMAGSIIAMLAEQPFWLGILGGIGFAIVIATVFTAANLLKVLITLLAYIGITFPLAGVYSYILTGNALINQTALTIAIHLSFVSIVAAWIAVTYSRKSAWATLALAEISTMTLSFLLLLVVPSLGIYSAYISMAFVLALRCGFFDRMSDSLRLIFKRDQYQLTAGSSLSSLASIEDDYLIREANTLCKNVPANNHLVIGPSGIYLIYQLNADNHIRETSSKGIEIDGLDISVLTQSLLKQRKQVAKKLGVSEKDVQLIVLADENNKLGELVRRVGVYSPKDGNLASAEIIFVTPNLLATFISEQVKILGTLKKDLLGSRFYSSK